MGQASSDSYHLLYPAVLLLICIGVYSSNNNVFDIYIVLIFGVVGFLMRKFHYPAAPLLLGFILGPLLEEHFRRALLLSQGNPLVFFERPISAVFLVVCMVFLASAFLPRIRLFRKQPQ